MNEDFLDSLTRIEYRHQACGETVSSFVLSDDSSYQAARNTAREHSRQCWASKRQKEDA